jgi:hypothetical protein
VKNINKNVISGVLIVLSLLVLYTPATYYGFLDYVINNTVINMNLDRDTIETEKASVAIFNGAGLNFLSNITLCLMTIAGMLLLYTGMIVKFIGTEVLTKAYWINFRIRP